MTTVLSRTEIKRLLKDKPPLVEELVDPEQQLQPNGIDLTLRDIALMQSAGVITVDNGQRQISELAPLVFDGLGYIDLVPGIYLITYNEVVHMPENVTALAAPRSSLLRCGVDIKTAVWDAGYSGRSQSLMVVYNPQGIRLQRNARVVQLIFFKLAQKTSGYQGKYQRENI
jgi:dUTP pyrophosphatase